MLQKFRSLIRYAKVFKNWPTAALLRYLGHRLPNPTLLQLRNGKKLSLNPSLDQVAMGEIFVAGGYDTCLSQTNPQLIWDVGGNIGCFTIWASQHFPHAHFHSFEPAPETFQRLKRNQQDNKDIQWVIHPFGLGARNETCTAYITSNSGETSRYGRGGVSIEFQLKNIDDVWIAQGKPQIDILKLDCEGGEYDIVASASDEYFNSVNCIVMELHDLSDFDPNLLLARLEAAGFLVTRPPTVPGIVTATRPSKPR